MQSKGLFYCLVLSDGSKNNLPTTLLNQLFKIYFFIAVILTFNLVFQPQYTAGPVRTSYLLSFALLIPILLILNELKKNKLLSATYLVFTLRFAISCFIPFSAIASFAGGAVHGTEYLHVAHRLGLGKRAAFLTWLPLLLILIICWTVFRYPFYLFHDFFSDHMKIVGNLMLAVIAALTHGHYFLDHYLFSARYVFSKDLFLKRLT